MRVARWSDRFIAQDDTALLASMSSFFRRTGIPDRVATAFAYDKSPNFGLGKSQLVFLTVVRAQEWP